MLTSSGTQPTRKNKNSKEKKSKGKKMFRLLKKSNFYTKKKTNINQYIFVC